MLLLYKKLTEEILNHENVSIPSLTLGLIFGKLSHFKSKKLIRKNNHSNIITPEHLEQ